MNRKEILTLALLIAILPPAWAVVSPYLGNTVGPVALITAGIYGANGNKWQDAHRMSLGLLAGDIWAYTATVIMSVTPLNPDLTLFIVLAVLGWAIGMLAMNLDHSTPLLSLTVQIAAAMLVGIYYVGALIDKLHRIINK